MDSNIISTKETMYFESSRKSIQFAQDEDQGDEAIGAILVENGHSLYNDKNHNSRDSRGKELQFSWINIWSIIETFLCRFFLTYDSDHTDYYEEWEKAKGRCTQAPTPAPTTPKPTWEADDDIYVWCNQAFEGPHW